MNSKLFNDLFIFVATELQELLPSIINQLGMLFLAEDVVRLILVSKHEWTFLPNVLIIAKIYLFPYVVMFQVQIT